MKDGVTFVEIELYDSKGVNQLYSANWRSSGSKNFSIPFNYRLYPSEKYDFRINYFQLLSNEDKQDIKNQLLDRFNTFINGNTKRTADKVQLNKSAKQMSSYLDAAISEIFLQYRPAVDLPGQMMSFSDAVKDKLKAIDGQSAKSDSSTVVVLDELKAQVKVEVDRIFSREYVEIVDSKYVDNYETERKRGAVSINLGYGGVYLDGGLDDLTYGAAPFVGLAFPLGNNKLSPVLGNASITLGVFTEDFEDQNGVTVTGFIVPKPIYLGLDYKLFQFIRLNAGATFLETENDQNEMGGSEIIVRPFVGIGARINLNINIDK